MKRVLDLDTQDFVVYGFLKASETDMEFTAYAESTTDRIRIFIDKEDFDVVAMLPTPCYSKWRKYFRKMDKPISWVSASELASYQSQYRYGGHYADARALADLVSECP